MKSCVWGVATPTPLQGPRKSWILCGCLTKSAVTLLQWLPMGLKPGLSMLILLSRRLAATRRSVKWPDLEITQTRKICFLLTFPWWPGDHPGWPGDCPGWLGEGTGWPTVYPSWPEDHPRWPEDLLGWLEDCFGWPKDCPGLPKDFPGWPKDHLD